MVESMARMYLKAGDEKKLFDVLALLAGGEPDNIVMRKKLTQLAIESKHFEAAEHWANDSLYVDVQDADSHRMLAEALVGRKEYASAVSEYETAAELEPNSIETQFALADACLRAGRADRARKLLQEILAAEPNYPGATELLEQAEKQKQ